MNPSQKWASKKPVDTSGMFRFTFQETHLMPMKKLEGWWLIAAWTGPIILVAIIGYSYSRAEIPVMPPPKTIVCDQCGGVFARYKKTCTIIEAPGERQTNLHYWCYADAPKYDYEIDTWGSRKFYLDEPIEVNSDGSRQNPLSGWVTNFTDCRIDGDRVIKGLHLYKQERHPLREIHYIDNGTWVITNCWYER